MPKCYPARVREMIMILDKTCLAAWQGCMEVASGFRQGVAWLFPTRPPRLPPRVFPQSERVFMGKGDIKSRRGKIYRGSFGKSRPKDPAKKKAAAAKALKK